VEPDAEGDIEGSGPLSSRGTGGLPWVDTWVLQDQRTKDGYKRVHRGRSKGIDGVDRDKVWTYFWNMMPVEELDEGIAIMLQKGKLLWPDFSINRDLFCKWMGCWFRMCGDKKRSQEEFWAGTDERSLSVIMTWDSFRKIKRVLSFPTYDDDAQEKLDDMGAGPDRMAFIRRWLHACNKQWKAAWEPGTHLVVDETMVMWTGLGAAHLTYIPRKPSPLGIMMKVACCADSGVLVHAELVEGAEVDHKKKSWAALKSTTACTIRLTNSYQGSGRIVIGDAWFGSVRTVEELRKVGLYAIMCVKQGCAGYPRLELKQAMRTRGDQRFKKRDMWLNAGILPMWAGAHMDKQPLLLCATTGTSLEGEKRYAIDPSSSAAA